MSRVDSLILDCACDSCTGGRRVSLESRKVSTDIDIVH